MNGNLAGNKIPVTITGFPWVFIIKAIIYGPGIYYCFLEIHCQFNYSFVTYLFSFKITFWFFSLPLIFCSFTTIYYPGFSWLIQLEDSYFFSLVEKFQTLIGWLQSLIFSLSSCSRTLIRHVSLSHSILYLFYFTFSFWTTC